MILIKKAYVYTKEQFRVVDILIDEDRIIKMEENISIDPSFQVINAKDKIIVPGFIDMHVHLREPGYNHKETIKSGTKAAIRGGFTTIAAMPNTQPVVDSVQAVKDLKTRIKKDASSHVLIFSSITKQELGEELVNIEALAQSGIIGFSDDGRGVQSLSLMKEAMLRAKLVNIAIVAHCEDEKYLHPGGIMHEGTKSDEYKVIGIPSQSEFEQIKRDIEIVKEIGCHYHICHISTKESIELIRQAKNEGINVSCEVTPHHLLLCDKDVDINNANYKMNPPLRSKADQEALIKGLKDGTIDIIATDHAPHSEEEKSRGFQKAPFGIVGLETCFPLLYTHLVLKGVITLEKLVNMMSIEPARLFSLDTGHLKVGAIADLTLIDLKKKQRIDPHQFVSQGKNTPFIGQVCQGVIQMTLVNGKIEYKECS